MKKFSWLLTIFLFINAVSGAYAQQQDHFVYIQSDDKTPFDVTVNGTTYTSSAIGYVIVPKLAKGDYKFAVGFPNKKFPDQEFSFTIDKVDMGFALKNYGDKGWGLYNLQTLDITMAGGKALSEVAADAGEQPNNNAFGNMLSEVVDDSTLNKKVILEKTAEQKAAEAFVQQQNTGIKAADTATQFAKAQPVAEKESVSFSAQTKPLSKLNEFISAGGRDVIFVDNGNGLNDTIRIFLPKTLTDLQEEAVAAKSDTVATPRAESNPAIQKEEIADTAKSEVTVKTGEPGNPFFNAGEDKSRGKDLVETEMTRKDETKDQRDAKPVALTPPNCAGTVSESDVDKLRKRIVSASGEEKMLAAVRKTIQDKCISTTQVKSLGPLFPSDDSRFNFLKTVFTSVSDTDNLASLDSQLIDPVYKTRFKELLR
ncbi:DUF4476 domain-containing protein [Panacibacter sp. DH6]|uniref:DUF4476 domain-containing protein n=1 Tax=Panacibacter microcysteis TaxID=2793269 RepID=A0A931E747_9BACT|nr:DUF4476 domain-containing protein [Panacibacter microcysteis]MBG9374971.1 DUF4476 domain-containing protein [Panacibacter microcysteis]